MHCRAYRREVDICTCPVMSQLVTPGVRTVLKTLPKEGEEEPGGLALPASNTQAEYSGIPEKGKEQSMASGDLSQVLSYKQTHLKEWSTSARAWVRTRVVTH